MEVHARAAAWRRDNATTGVQPNRENASQEASRRDNAIQEARQRAGSVALAAPLEVVASQAVQGKNN